MVHSVDIHGKGIASACCAHLLEKRAVPVTIRAVERAPVPAIVLSDPALALLRDVFDRPRLFADRPRIDRRIVSWGGRDPVVLPHGAIVVSERDLDEALFAPQAKGAGASVAAEGAADFALLTAPPFPSGAPRRFGARRATAVAVRMADPEERSACRVEATDEGWLFLMPTGDGEGWLLGVGAGVTDLLAHSRFVAPKVALAGAESAAFDTCPRLLPALCGEGWLACGTAAIAFDPICGDGTAQAVREAILAAALLRALDEGEPPEALRTHYESLMIAAMRRHLRLCADFYRSGGTGAWWRGQLEALLEGYRWCTERLATLPEPRYGLQGFRLVARAAAA